MQNIVRVVDVPVPREQELPSNKAHCIHSFDPTEDEVTRQIAGHKDALENYKAQLCCEDALIDTVRQSIPELDESVTKGDRSDRSRMQSS